MPHDRRGPLPDRRRFLAGGPPPIPRRCAARCSRPASSAWSPPRS